MRNITEEMDTFFNGRPAPRTAELEALRKECATLRAAAQEMIDAYQPHVMGERCRVCNLAWQKLREALR